MFCTMYIVGLIVLITFIYFKYIKNNKNIKKIKNLTENFENRADTDLIANSLTYGQLKQEILNHINSVYDIDVESIRNLGAISKSLLTGTNYHNTSNRNVESGVLTIPASTFIEGSAIIDGNVTINGELNITSNSLNLLPVGTVIMWTNNTIPKGWAECNGSNGTPNLSGKFILGRNDKHVLNKEGGSETHTLTVDEIPRHTHRLTSHGNDGGHAGWRSGLKTTDQGTNDIPFDSYNPSHAELTKIHETGGSKEHNNMPPYYVLIYIMKVNERSDPVRTMT